jgi:small-conductance mechanosensitive channel
MKDFIRYEKIETWLLATRDWTAANVFAEETLLELGVIVAAAVLSWALARPLRSVLSQLEERHARYRVVKATWHIAAVVALPALWLLFQWIAIAAAGAIGWRHGLLVITASLLTALIVIRIAASFVEDPLWGRTIATTAWVIAALNIVGLLDQTIALLDQFAMTFGAVRISALTVIKGVLALAVLLWISTILSNVFENRMKASPNLTPSVQVLFTKLFKITLVIVAFIAAISSVGIDLTAFAVFGGAIGVGVGFGLQKIVANLMSGLILLLDKSIKPGDVIAVANYYGRVDSLGARYVSVTTRDGIEHLIPNEELIINRVENWSHSQNLYRIRLPVGVHYKSDVHKAIALCIEAANETERVLDEPKTVCLLRGFGDSSVDLEIRFWINDPMNGRANVRSQILVRIWDKFHAHGIEIPYPQRDLHLRTPYVGELSDFAQVVRP